MNNEADNRANAHPPQAHNIEAAQQLDETGHAANDAPSPANRDQPSEFTLSVFYDGSCPLCVREIAYYRRRDGAERIKWMDVSGDNHNAPAPQLSCAAAMARFHVLHADGKLSSGAQAFSELWLQLPAFRWLGQVTRVPGIAWLAEYAYRLFLRARPGLIRMLFK